MVEEIKSAFEGIKTEIKGEFEAVKAENATAVDAVKSELEELKILRTHTFNSSVCEFKWHNSDIISGLKCRECGSSDSKY